MTHVSPSQIETWRGCQRRWAYSRIRPRHENVWAAFGTRVHDVLERWSKHRETPDHRTPEGLCALAAVPEIPHPQTPGVAAEHPFAFVSDGTQVVLADLVAPRTATCNGHTASGKDDPDALANAARAAAAALGDPWVAYVGRIDLIDGYTEDRVWIRVTDYKTCGDLARAEEMRERFETDVQRIVYAFYMRARAGVHNVRTRWLYLRRNPPKAEAVEMFEGGDVRHRFAYVHRTFSLPIVRAHGIHPTELPRSLEHCYAYGTRSPCPYLAECHATLDPTERAAALMSAPERGRKQEQSMNDLMAQLGASLVPAVATNATPPAAPVDPFAGWSDQDREAFNAIQNPPPGATQEIVVTFLAANGKQHVVDAAVRMGVIAAPGAPAPATPQQVRDFAGIPAPQPIAAPSASPAAARVRARSLKIDVVENMLRAVLAGAGHSVEQTEQHIARLLG